MPLTSSSGRRLVALPARQDAWLVDAVATAWERGEAICVVDTTSPLLRQRLDALGAHILRLETSQITLDPSAPLLRDDAWIVQVTSGTTGAPKAVVLTESNVRASARAVSDRLGITGRDHWTTALSPAFIGGLATVARAIVEGTAITLLPRHRAEHFARAIAQGATLTTTVASALEEIDPRPFRAVILGAQPTSDELAPNMHTSYGMTETGSGVVYDGVALPGVEVRLTNGLIELRGPMIAQTYRTGAPTVGPDGWLATGDVGLLRDGLLEVLGRAGDLINSGGHHVPPDPVEAAVRRALAGRVVDLAVYGSADERFGETVTLAVVAEHPPTSTEVRAALDGLLEAPWIPRRIVTVPSIPRTETGKPLRRLLPGAVARTPRPPTTEDQTTSIEPPG